MRGAFSLEELPSLTMVDGKDRKLCNLFHNNEANQNN